MASCGTCPTQWVHAERRSHCTVCHATFSSHGIGDAHRTGGECLTDVQMWGRGWVRRQRPGWQEWGGPDLPDDVKDRWSS